MRSLVIGWCLFSYLKLFRKALLLFECFTCYDCVQGEQHRVYGWSGGAKMELVIDRLRGFNNGQKLCPPARVANICDTMDRLHNVLQQPCAGLHPHQTHQQVLFPRWQFQNRWVTHLLIFILHSSCSWPNYILLLGQ